MHRRLILLPALLFIFFLLSAQQNSVTRGPSLGVSFLLNDFASSDYIRQYSLARAFADHRFGRLRNMAAGAMLSFQQGINPHVDFAFKLAGSFTDMSNRNSQILGTNQFLLENDLTLIGKLFDDRKRMNPYLEGGIGYSLYNGRAGIYFPLGIGLQFRLSSVFFLQTVAQYRASISYTNDTHFFYGLGFSQAIGKQKKSHSISHPGNAIVDSLHAGSFALLKEDPDADHDGIPDAEDKCPLVPGFLRYAGCPVPDSDGDGINDEEDSCRLTPGLLRYHGCPVPDTDQDGVNDEQDSCITVPGVRSNHGCPQINPELAERVHQLAQKIYFATGSYRLLEKSYPALNEVTSILKSGPDFFLSIEGHTDNVGTANYNLVLSENRARVIREYLVTHSLVNSKRITSKGYGFSRPAGNNNTSQGRALNRRVELNISVH